MKIGVRLPTSGAGTSGASVLTAAKELEAAGFDSLWVSDHVLQPSRIDSHYPYSADGTATWDTETPYLEAISVLAAVAAVTTRAELGTAVLVLPQRQPVVLAKQLATVDSFAGGRLTLGVGAGWMAEEFLALGADFAARGATMDEAIDVLRSCWTGWPAERIGGTFPIPAGMVSLPTPERTIPILIGGASPAAFRRVVARGDGWLAQVDCTPAGADLLVEQHSRLLAKWTESGRNADDLAVVVRLTGDAVLLESVLPTIAASGIDHVVLTPPADGSYGEVLEAARAALGD
jgi:probable F420-dependent oxidoreductase